MRISSHSCVAPMHAFPKNLKLAFFGSDAFSVLSLKRLRQLQEAQPSLISSIDVYTRSIKPTGRNLKQLVDVPIGTYAREHNLPVHRVDTLLQIVDTALSKHYHLAVAVSYGKLIPGRFLETLPFGGLNVHPSVLPEFSGSSPIQHALMKDCKSTGVTVQTLHPTKFDCGEIIAQTTDVPVEFDDNFSSLQETLGVLGAELLAEVLSRGLYVDPKPLRSPTVHSLAPKLTSESHEAKWEEMTSREVKRLYDALGSVHTYKNVRLTKKGKTTEDYYKVILEDVKEIHTGDMPSLPAPGDFALCGEKVVIRTSDGFISAGSLKLQYCKAESALQFVAHLGKRCGDTGASFESKPTSF